MTMMTTRVVICLLALTFLSTVNEPGGSRSGGSAVQAFIPPRSLVDRIPSSSESYDSPRRRAVLPSSSTRTRASSIYLLREDDFFWQKDNSVTTLFSSFQPYQNAVKSTKSSKTTKQQNQQQQKATKSVKTATPKPEQQIPELIESTSIPKNSKASSVTSTTVAKNVQTSTTAQSSPAPTQQDSPLSETWDKILSIHKAMESRQARIERFLKAQEKQRRIEFALESLETAMTQGDQATRTDTVYVRGWSFHFTVCLLVLQILSTFQQGNEGYRLEEEDVPPGFRSQLNFNIRGLLSSIDIYEEHPDDVEDLLHILLGHKARFVEHDEENFVVYFGKMKYK